MWICANKVKSYNVHPFSIYIFKESFGIAQAIKLILFLMLIFVSVPWPCISRWPWFSSALQPKVGVATILLYDWYFIIKFIITKVGHRGRVFERFRVVTNWRTHWSDSNEPKSDLDLPWTCSRKKICPWTWLKLARRFLINRNESERFVKSQRV